MNRQILILISLAALIVFYCTEQVEGCSRRRRRNCDRPRPVVCRSGYTNPPSCNVPICLPSCSNGGTCIGPDTCRCPYGWTGALCDKAVCPAGCVHGNCVRPGCCICYSGWHGTNCNTPVCSGGCNNGGTCIYPNTCRCRSGWQGPTCNEAICSGGCKNGGICIWPNTCRCAQGWTGKNCEQAICLDSCYHGGSCVRPETCQCAYGWEGKSCKDAICQKTCQNGAVCTQPNMCACPLGWTGDTCEQVKCGSEFDCYPGTCQDGTQSPTCECVEGFTGQNCEEINIKPRFETCEVSVLSEVPAYPDVTASCGLEVYTNLTSMLSFTTNILLVFDEPQYVNEYPKGGYLRNYKVGLINASYSITTTHADDRVTTNSYKCSTDVHTYNPLSRISCRINKAYTAGFVHDDVVEVKAVAISGGYKEVRKEDTGNEYRNITFNGEIESKSVLFRIDHRRPHHCSEDSAPSCETPLSASNDVTDVPYVSLLFAGWSDADSGISEYRYSIYQMTVNGEGELQENTNPVKTDRFSATNIPEAFFTLPSFGMYSIIGEVVDQAGNIGFCRALVLYVDKEKPIERKDKSLMATNTTNTIGNVLWRTDTTADINISWKGIFSNPYLENYSYLAKVKASPVKNIIDYMNGNISTKGIPNRSGITEFQYQKLPYIQKSEAAASRAKRSLSEPPQTWISTDLSEEITINSITSGQGITLWVKAKDILGNFLTDYWYILADNSPPQVTVLEFKRNVTGPQRGYYSSVDMEVRDTESGVFRIDYTIYDTTGNPRRLINKSSQSAQLEYDKNACILNGTCSCTDLQCYANVQRVFINNCIFVEFLDVPLQFVAEVYNNANLSTSVVYDLGKVEAVSGIDEYPPPYGFFVERAFGSGALLNWYLPNACYSIYSVNIDFKDGTGRSIIHPNRTSAELDGLKSHTMYTVELYIIYENRQKSERVPLSFDSGSYVGDDGGLSVGAIIGIVIGVLFFIAIIAIVVLMLIRVKMRNKPAVPHNITRTASNAFSRISKYFTHQNPHNDSTHHADKGMTNIFYGGGGPKLQDFEDDIYVYGEMDTDPKAKWKYSIDQVSMSKLLCAGRFAEIRLGTLKVDKDKRLVAVKMLKEQTEDNIRLMKAKMNFLATAVPHHNNIVNFIGAVTEGPLILLEYCEHSLKDWLKNIKEVTDEVEDNMVNFCTDIARGMAHLHSNEIVHRRLGARNVLLKKIETMGRLVAKVTGFGPMKGETLKDAGPDHIPIKWMAPEQIGLGKNAKRPYDKKTDVWSYGITIWEIYSIGKLPFSGLKHSEVKRIIMAGERPERPSFCSEELYDEIMMRCWQIDPSERPQLSEIRSKLERIFHGSADGDEYYADDYDSGVIYDDTMYIP